MAASPKRAGVGTGNAWRRRRSARSRIASARSRTGSRSTISSPAIRRAPIPAPSPTSVPSSPTTACSISAAAKIATGNETISDMSQRPAHQEAIEGGLAHFAGLPHVDARRRPRGRHVLSADPGARTHRPSRSRSRRMACPRAIASIASARTAGSSYARAPAGRSSAARSGRSTDRSRRSISCARRSPAEARQMRAHRGPQRLARVRHAGRERAGVAGVSFDIEAVAIPLSGRPVRLRQDDAAQHHRRLSRADRAAKSASAARPSPASGTDRGIVFQDFAQLFPWRTALGNVAFGLEMKGVARPSARTIALEQLRAGQAREIRARPIRTISPAACSSGSPSRARSRTIRPCF